MNHEQLVRNLDAVGKRTATWESSDGTSVLLLPYGGRILGLFAPGDNENFFWTHSALEDIPSTRAFYAGEEWHNSGGERTWLAPEVDLFFPEYPSLDRYWQQRELDPGQYQLCHDRDNLSLKTLARLMLSRSKQQIEVEITKALGPALNPLRYDGRKEWISLKFAGYTLRTTLRLLGTNRPSYVGLWHLAQMPHGGEMLVPTFFRSQPKVYMGNIDAEDLLVSEHLVRYKMRAKGEHKLGIRAIAITGRAGYLYTRNDVASLIVCNFNVDPSGEYVDVPWLEPDNFGFAFQACNVDSHLGAFSELEYHVPAIGETTGRFVSQDVSQIWAFRGPEPLIRSVAQNLLSAEA